jgi:large subunit ribosomal protein L5e
MPFVKVVKNKSYFKRYQVKYRRRREGLTDYQARKNLIVQDLNKYGTPKFRLVVRFTNKDIVAQIIYAKVKGDVVLSAAYAHELPSFGIQNGLTNYAAAYATGLLLARRALTKLKLAAQYVGVENADGKYFVVEPVDDGPRPFYVLLDVGLTRTSTGNRVFGAMKGAADGGLDIPHSERRLAGYLHNKEERKSSVFDPAILRKYIFGGHVASYMKILQKEDAEAYKRQFSKYVASGVTADNLEGVYKKAHAAIRAKPEYVKKAKKDVKHKRYNLTKLTLEQRQKSLAARKAAQ